VPKVEQSTGTGTAQPAVPPPVMEEVHPAPQTADHVFVSIPDQDIYGYVHPTIRVNRYEFQPGKTYKVRRDVGEEVMRRLQAFQLSSVRLMRPKADTMALRDVNRGSNWQVSGAQVGSVGSYEGILQSLAPNEKIIELKD
jgi:hypothetical protein